MFASGCRRARLRIIRNHGDAGFIVGFQMPGRGAINQVFLEPRLGCRQFLLQRLELLLVFRIQRDTRQFERQQCIIKNLALRRIELQFVAAPLQHERALIQRLVLSQLGRVVGHQRQAGVVRIAQGGTVHNRIQVTDLRPAARQAIVHHFQRQHEIVPVRQVVDRQQLRELPAILLQDLRDGRNDVFRADGGVIRQTGVIEQWIGHVDDGC